MNITLSLDAELVKKARKIAAERDSTLTDMVRAYLEKLAGEDAVSGRRRREREALERTFESFQFGVGKRTRKRVDLHQITSFRPLTTSFMWCCERVGSRNDPLPGSPVCPY